MPVPMMSGTTTSIPPVICGEMATSAAPHPATCAALRSPCETHSLNDDLKSCTSVARRETSSPDLRESKKVMSCRTTEEKSRLRISAATRSPTHERL